ncbi:ubiquitin carboxyl-terminal hydrolase 29-like isoform X2 [Tigriopus californicus]|uniref:ubiquitin carboxyl-terminal hydrolase 29-like isoform X2 n=1 Tax=Tigriopus californicus TaxID=6832 RepID=UPI0027DA3555|nr:ubiquitin carboxyl-terminal hydrolase 29-like isoform X2 [Tigriopus californicus]
MPPTDSTSLTPPLSPPKRPFRGSTSTRADSSRPSGSSLVPHHGWLGRTSPGPGPQGEEEEEEEEPQMKSPMSDSALLTTPRNSLRTAEQAEGRSQSLTLSSKKRSAFRRRLQPQWDTLRLGRHSAPGKSQTSSACSRVSAGGDENRDPIVHGKRSKSPSGRATTPRRNLFGERSAITGQAIPALGTKESVGASASTFYGAKSQMTPVLVSSPRALKSALKNGREAVGRTRGLLGDDLAHHPGVRAKRVRSRPVPIEEVGEGGVPPMIPLTDFALPIDSSMKPAVFVDPHRVGLPNIGMTCYMNSVLQCLFSLPPFKQSLKSIRESVSSAVQNEPELLDNVSILRAITDLMTDREKGQMSHIDEKVRYLQAEFQKIRQEFQLGCQQDAHEFLTQLFDAIEFQSMTLMANDSSVQCPVSENFEYNVSVVKTCSQCDTKLHSTLKDTMWKLNSPRSNTKNLTSLIQNSLTSTVKANCPQCEAKAKANGATYEGTLAHQVYEFETLPRVFMLHLPRMHYYKNHSGDYACDKREIPIEIPPVLNMEELAVPSDQMFKRLQNYTDIEESFDEHKNYHVELELLDPEITFKRPSNPANYAVNSRISSQNGEALDYSRKSYDVKNISPVKPPNRGGPGSLSPLTELECSAFSDENGNVQSTARNPSSRSVLQQGLTEAATAMLGLGNDLGWIREKQPSPDSVQEVPNSCVVRQDSPDDSREDDTSLGESNMDIDEELRSNGIHITEDLFEQEENASDGVALNKQLCVEVDEPRPHVEGGEGRLVLTFDHKEHDTSDLSRTESAASDFSHSSFSSKGDELDDVSASVSDEDTKIIRTFNNKVDNPYFNYYLVAMVNHIGESVNSGHYKADVYSLEKEQWFRYDDDRVREISHQRVLSENAIHGYLFVYLHKSYFKRPCRRADKLSQVVLGNRPTP